MEVFINDGAKMLDSVFLDKKRSYMSLSPIVAILFCKNILLAAFAKTERISKELVFGVFYKCTIPHRQILPVLVLVANRPSKRLLGDPAENCICEYG